MKYVLTPDMLMVFCCFAEVYVLGKGAINNWSQDSHPFKFIFAR